MVDFFKKYQTQIQLLCREFHVERLYAFGSVLTKNFKSKSDVDLVVEFKDFGLKGYAFNFFQLKQKLEEMFGRPVDLLENQAIRNPFLREEIDETKMLVYDGEKDKEMAV